MLEAPVAIMSPHSGVGTRTPAPTKLSPAVSSMATPIVMEAWLMMIPSTFGMRWRRMIRSGGTPRTMAASTKVRSRRDSSSARISRT